MAHRLPPQDGAPGTPQENRFEAEIDEVLFDWFSDPGFSLQTVTRMSETIGRYSMRLEAQGFGSFIAASKEAARGFITAALPDGRPAEVNTQHARRTTLRTLYRTLQRLGHEVWDPTTWMELPPRSKRAARPLTDDEVALCRIAAQVQQRYSGGGWTRGAAWALAEATAVTSEITAVVVDDLDDPQNPTTVRLPGTARLKPRIGVLSEWGRKAVTAQIEDLGPLTWNGRGLLCYSGEATPGGAKAQAAASNAIRAILNGAGLYDEPDLRPSSVRHWAGRAMYDEGLPIEKVAARLGHRSLDATAEDIALEWQGPSELDEVEEVVS